MIQRKVLIQSKITNDMKLVLTDAPKEKIEEWCYRYNWMCENGTVVKALDSLWNQYKVIEIFDATILDDTLAEAVGYDEKYDLSLYYPQKENPVYERLSKLFADVPPVPSQSPKIDVKKDTSTMSMLKEIERSSRRIKDILALGISCDKKGLDISPYIAENFNPMIGFGRNSDGEIIGLAVDRGENIVFCVNGSSAFGLNKTTKSLCNPQTDDIKGFLKTFDSFEKVFYDFADKAMNPEKESDEYGEWFR